jgi:hypothetical protein
MMLVSTRSIHAAGPAAPARPSGRRVRAPLQSSATLPPSRLCVVVARPPARHPRRLSVARASGSDHRSGDGEETRLPPDQQQQQQQQQHETPVDADSAALAASASAAPTIGRPLSPEPPEQDLGIEAIVESVKSAGQVRVLSHVA